jgi:hypothetical protein
LAFTSVKENSPEVHHRISELRYYFLAGWPIVWVQIPNFLEPSQTDERRASDGQHLLNRKIFPKLRLAWSYSN